MTFPGYGDPETWPPGAWREEVECPECDEPMYEDDEECLNCGYAPLDPDGY